MAEFQIPEESLHCGYSIEKGNAILSDHEYRLSQSNVVSIDIGWKVVSVAVLIFSVELSIPYMMGMVELCIQHNTKCVNHAHKDIVWLILKFLKLSSSCTSCMSILLIEWHFDS